MAELISYDPSTDPQAVQSAVERDAESLAKHEEYEAQRQNPYAGKYDSPEQLEQAYLELQKKLGQDGGDEGEPEQDAELDESEEDYSDDTDEVDTDEPLMEVMDLLNEEYDETGTLSEESIEALSELPAEDLVQAYLQYQDKLGSVPTGREMTDAEVASVYDMAGGQDQYEAMTEWASENFGADEIEAFDQVIESGNMSAIKLAMRALTNSYNDSVGYEGSMLQGKPASTRAYYRSQAEVIRDMQDPRYDRDPAYRDSIMEKLARSDLDY